MYVCVKNMSFCKPKGISVHMEAKYNKHKLTNLFHVSQIVTIHYFEFDKHFRHPGEKHDFWEFVYIDKGEALITAETTQLNLKQGEGIFHKPNEFHQVKANGIVAPNIFIISFVCNSPYMKTFEGKSLTIPVKLRPIISQILEEGKKTFVLPFNATDLKELELKEDAPAGSQQMIRIYLEQLLILLLRDETTVPSPYTIPPREDMEGYIVKKAKKMMDDAVYSTSVTTDDLCQYLGYSRTYLSRIFKNRCGCTLTQYMSQQKIDEAKRLIREENYNFTQISDMLYFSNPLYFSRVFHRVTGMSPSEYLKSVKTD